LVSSPFASIRSTDDINPRRRDTPAIAEQFGAGGAGEYRFHV